MFGDGIAHVQATADGQIWVGYFDEGVFGNYGWGDPGPPPIGQYGLVRFTSELTVDWEFRNAPGAGIADCYALTIADGTDSATNGHTVWTCYYTDFPLVRITDGQVRSWDTTISGASGLAVDADRVCFLGGYQPNHDRLVVSTLTENGVQPTGTYRLTHPGGRELPRGQLGGRGDQIHHIGGGWWSRLAVNDIPGTGSAQ